jgi:hypothetical protein
MKFWSCLDMSKSRHFGLPALSRCCNLDIPTRQMFFVSRHFAQTGNTNILVGFRGSWSRAITLPTGNNLNMGNLFIFWLDRIIATNRFIHI